VGGSGSEGVAVAIANWNGRQTIARCLDAVLAQSHPPSEIVVVDNGSTDGSAEWVAANYPQAVLIRRTTNEGVSRAYNLAIRRSRSPYVLILNTDVFLDRGFLFAGVKALESCPAAGFVAARVLDDTTGDVANTGQWLRPWISVVNDSRPDDLHRRPAFAASGAALLCRRATLEDVQVDGEYLDESFFAYLEDVDLAWRARLRGWKCLYEPGAVARHVGSASHGGRVRVTDKPAFLQRHIWKNRYLIVFQNASAGELALLMPWLCAFELLYWPYLLLRIPARLPVFLGAHCDAARALPGAARKRRRIQRRRRAGLRHLMGAFRLRWRR
jgi:GT2 family glycosyltransferase